MKSAVLFSELMKAAPCYRWRWRSDDGENESTQSFGYYLDCLSNARANGYDVRSRMAIGPSSPHRIVFGHFPGSMQGEGQDVESNWST